MTRQEVITKLLDTYSKYGVTSDFIEHVVKKGEMRDVSYQTICTALRVALGREFGEQELFTVEEITDFLGWTPEQIEKEQQKRKERMLAFVKANAVYDETTVKCNQHLKQTMRG